MYLIVIAWFYVTAMMAVVEATSPQGSLLGAAVTFILYGALPMGVLIYIFGTPERKRKLKQRRQDEQRAYDAAHANPALATDSSSADTSGHASSGAEGRRITPVGKEL